MRGVFLGNSCCSHAYSTPFLETSRGMELSLDLYLCAALLTVLKATTGAQ